MTSFIPYPRNLVKTQEVTNQSYCIWLQVGNNTDCFWDLTYGEWYWSDKLSDIYIGFKNVIVDEANDEGLVVYHLHVAENDMGRVIGKQGRIAKAIRTVMRAAANQNHEKIVVEID